MISKQFIITIIILSLLLSGASSTDMFYIGSIISVVHRIAAFQDIAWFISKRLNTQNDTNVDTFMIYIDKILALPQTVVTSNTKLRMVQSSSKRILVSLVLTTGVDDPIMDVYNKVLTGRHSLFSIIVLNQPIKDMKLVYDMCNFMYKYNYLNSLLYFQSTDGTNQLFSFNKFPKMEIRNRTDFLAYLKEKARSIESAITDTEGYKFQTPLKQDLPHLFKYFDFQGHLHYEGSTYRIIKTFVDLLNGSFVDYSSPSDANETDIVNMKSVLNLVTQRKIEFSAHAYALFRANEEIESSYPLIVVRWCLMVPLYNSISTYLYPLQPFTWEVWFSIIGVFVALLALELFWICSTWKRYNRKKKLSLLLQDVILDNFCYMINISTAKPLRNPSILRFLLLATVLFHGFFLSANYTSVLGSILTVNLFHAQINTMEDIIKAALPVMIIDYELDFLRSEGNEFPQPFEDLIKPVDVTTFAEHQHKFNTSFAYFVTEDKWRFLDNQQKHLKQRIFKFSDICFGSYHLAYPMQKDSVLWRDLEYYTFRIHSSGLLNFYERNTFDYAEQAKLMNRIQQTSEYTSAGLHHLAIAFIVLLTSCALAGIVLGIEIIWFNLTVK